MPIRNFPFHRVTEDKKEPFRPWVPIQIHNPHSGAYLTTFGLIDSGADSCAIPASFAKKLGHKLTTVRPLMSHGASGKVWSYPHATSIDILNWDSDVLHSIPNTPIEFVNKLPCVLLGVKNFMNEFILQIDYPKQLFSIKYSKKYLAP